MRRLPLTLGLTTLTAVALTTAAIAAPTGPGPADCPMVDDPSMTAMHADPDGMLAMHDHMMTMHPEMAVHLEDAGLDADQVRGWMTAGLDHDEMHQRMRQAGADVDGMHASCPMTGHGHGPSSGASMGDHDRHHR